MIAPERTDPSSFRSLPAQALFFELSRKKAIMQKTSKAEIGIATWTGGSGPVYWGDCDFIRNDSQSTSFLLSLNPDLFRGTIYRWHKKNDDQLKKYYPNF